MAPFCGSPCRFGRAASIVCVPRTRAIVSLFVLAAVCWGWVAARGWAQESPFDRCGLAVRVDSAPVIDGYLDDPQWEGAERLTGFTIAGSPSSLPEAQTVGRLLFDKTHLYIAVECLEPHMSLLVSRKRPRDDAIWSDDSVEIHLDPHREQANVFEVIVNAHGSFYDAISVPLSPELPFPAEQWPTPPAAEIELDESWNGEVKVRAQRLADRWTAEISVSFASLGAPVPRDGDTWGFDLFRWQRSTGVAVKSAWSNTGSTSFDVPSRYGSLIFGSYGSAGSSLAAVALRNLAQIEQQLAQVRQAAGGQELGERLEGLRRGAQEVLEALKAEPPPALEEAKRQYLKARELLAQTEEASWDVKFFALLSAPE